MWVKSPIIMIPASTLSLSISFIRYESDYNSSIVAQCPWDKGQTPQHDMASCPIKILLATAGPSPISDSHTSLYTELFALPQTHTSLSLCIVPSAWKLLPVFLCLGNSYFPLDISFRNDFP